MLPTSRKPNLRRAVDKTSTQPFIKCIKEKNIKNVKSQNSLERQGVHIRNFNHKSGDILAAQIVTVLEDLSI